MLDIIIEEIIEYITEELGGEDAKLRHLVKSINFDLKRLYPPQRKKYHKYLSEDIKKYKNLVDEIKGIRKAFQKGKHFVYNQTKGTTKRFTLINLRIASLKMGLEYKGLEYAKEQAIHDLYFIKTYNSERSYYRYKKRVQELGIEI